MELNENTSSFLVSKFENLKLDSLSTGTQPDARDNSRRSTVRRTVAKKDSSAYDQLKAKRQAKYDAKRDANIQAFETLRAQANEQADLAAKRKHLADMRKRQLLEERKKIAETARSAYQKRQYKRRVAAQSFLKTTDPNLKVTLDQRLKFHNRHHKCSHSLAHNRILLKNDVFDRFGCNHGQLTSKKRNDTNAVCHSCGAHCNFVCETKCECIFYLCGRCGKSTYEYLNNGVFTSQHYDKHTDTFGGITVTLDKKDVTTVCQADFVEKILKQPTPLVSKENFLRELKGFKHKTAWDRKKPAEASKPTESQDCEPTTSSNIIDDEFVDLKTAATVTKPKTSPTKYKRFGKNAPRLKIDLRDSKPESGKLPPAARIHLIAFDPKTHRRTTPEGGKITTFGGAASGAAKSIVEAITNARDKIKKKIADVFRTTKNLKRDYSLYKSFRNFLGCFDYYFEFFLDIITAVNPLLLANLLYDVKKGNWIRAIVHISSLLPSLAKSQEISRMRIMNWYMTTEQDPKLLWGNNNIKSQFKFGMLTRPFLSELEEIITHAPKLKECIRQRTPLGLVTIETAINAVSNFGPISPLTATPIYEYGQLTAQNKERELGYRNRVRDDKEVQVMTEMADNDIMSYEELHDVVTSLKQRITRNIRKTTKPKKKDDPKQTTVVDDHAAEFAKSNPTAIPLQNVTHSKASAQPSPASMSITDFDEIKTVVESGKLGAVSSLISTLFMNAPSKFATAAKVLSSICKQYLPILMTVKALKDTGKIFTDIAAKVWEWITGEKKNTKEWILSKMETPGNPLNDLAALMTVYFATCKQEDRAACHAALAKATEYVHSEKKFSTEWGALRNHIANAISDPPEPKEREQVPTCLNLTGSGGTGKSLFWPAFVAPLYVDPSTPVADAVAKVRANTYTWSATSNTHQVGLSTKDIVLFDDMGQSRNIDELAHYMALMSIASYPIESPAIQGREVKGCLADPKFVIVCSNDKSNTCADTVLDPEAFKRRFDLRLEVIAQYDPANPNKKTYKVMQSNYYHSLEGKELSLKDAQALFVMTHKRKLEKAAELKKIISDVAIPQFNININPSEGKTHDTSQLWRIDNNLEADYAKYITGNIPIFEPPKESEEASAAPEEESATTSKKKTIIGRLKSFFHIKSDPEIGVLSAAEVAATTLQYANDAWVTGSLIAAPVVVAYGWVRFSLVLESWYSNIMERFFARTNVTTIVTALLATISTVILAACVVISAWSVFTEESGEHHGKRTEKKVESIPHSGSSNDHLVRDATCTLIAEDGSCVNGIMVKGHYLLTVAHFFHNFIKDEKMEPGTRIQVHKPAYNGADKYFNFDPENLVTFNENVPILDPQLVHDVVLYRLPKTQFNCARDITSHFFNGDLFLNNRKVAKFDLEPYNPHTGARDEFTVHHGTVINDRVITRREDTTKTGGKKTVYMHKLVEANYTPRASSCGSIVKLTDQQETPILGVHAAGSAEGNSLFHIVTRQMLDDATKDPEVPKDVNLTVVNTHAEQGPADLALNPPKSVLNYVGKVKETCYRPVKTTLRKSEVFECYSTSITEPAPLSPYDQRIDDQYSGDSFYPTLFAGYAIDTTNALQIEDIDHAGLEMKRRIATIAKSSIVPTRLLSLHEAINGDHRIPANTRMDMTTSPGYPYVQRGLKKTDLFTEVDGVLRPTTIIEEDYYTALHQLQNGIVPFTPFTLTLKDERVKKHKVSKPGTRVFAGGNLISFLLCRRYFYSVLMQLYHNPISKSFCVPSLDRLSLQWHDLMSHLTSVGTYGFDFDFKHFDRSLSKALLYAGANAMLAPQKLPALEHNTVLEWITAPFSIFGRNVYQSHGVMMSGVLITYALNCVVNEIMHMAAWRSIMLEHNYNLVSFGHYHDYVRGVRGGDDTITLVDDRVLAFYNGKTVAAYLNAHGLTVTSPDKTADIPESTHMLKLSFLKNTTTVRNNKYLPLPDLDSSVEISYWIRETRLNRDRHKSTEDNIDCTLRSLYFHGRQIFDAFRDSVLEVDPSFRLAHYDDLHCIWTHASCYPGFHADYGKQSYGDDVFNPTVRTVQDRELLGEDSN